MTDDTEVKIEANRLYNALVETAPCECGDSRNDFTPVRVFEIDNDDLFIRLHECYYCEAVWDA